NALHYEILQRLALDVSLGSIETQSLSLRVDSLAGKVDFNERRVRTMEGTQVRAPRPQETSPIPQAASGAATAETTPSQPPPEGQSGEAPRRRRRRRRGRRGPGMGMPADAAAAQTASTAASEENAGLDEGDNDVDEGFEEE